MNSDSAKLRRSVWIGVALIFLIFLVVVISAVVLVPRTVNTLSRAQTVLGKVESFVDEANSTLEANRETAEAAIASVAEVADSANQLIQANSDVVTSTMEKLNAINFEKLAEAVDNLTNIVNSLSGVLQLFSSFKS
ncbi:MAG: hypothetical protein IJU29_07460 [Oscillospiraceae bacterium]|nr:hypothetical protein [Oscillospiraceae bacterium]